MLPISPRAFVLFTAVAGALASTVACVSRMTARGDSEAMQSFDATKRTVLITGANRGIGLELARQYHGAGWNVIGTARDPGAAKDLRAIGDDVLVPALDVTSQDSVATLAKSLEHQPIDLLINNAGVGDGGGSSLAKLEVDTFEHVMQVNALGPVRVTQALLPNLRAGKGRTIVSITSILGSIAGDTDGGYYGYRESKAALNMFMRSLAAELRPEKFICIPIHPGWVKTDMGGANAQLTVEESVTGIRKVVDGLKLADSGKFWSYDGTNLPW
jgi:NAD(P)-dependent dehydrogenase (short-subunit alcohol dehydrogenase family)